MNQGCEPGCEPHLVNQGSEAGVSTKSVNSGCEPGAVLPLRCIQLRLYHGDLSTAGYCINLQHIAVIVSVGGCSVSHTVKLEPM